MADEVALALQPGGSTSAAAAEREATSPPAGEPLRKRPRRDGPGLGRSPGEPERELPAAAGGCPAAALWREEAAGGEQEAQATAAGEEDNGLGLQGLSREPPSADDLYDDEGEEEEEAAAAIGYRGAQGAGGRDCASPPAAPPGVGWGRPAGSGRLGFPPRPSTAVFFWGSRHGSSPPLPFTLSPLPVRRPRALRSRLAGELSQLVLKWGLDSYTFWHIAFVIFCPHPPPATFACSCIDLLQFVFANGHVQFVTCLRAFNFKLSILCGST